MVRKREKSPKPVKKDKFTSLSDLGQKLMQALKGEDKKECNPKQATQTETDPTPIEDTFPSISIPPKSKKRIFIPDKLFQQRKESKLRPQSSPINKADTKSLINKKPPLKAPPVKKEKLIFINPWQSLKKNPEKERDLVIGFDLGSSSTKIVIQDRQLRKPFAVPFDSFCTNGSRYLLPTTLYRDPHRKFTLESNTTQVKDLKVNFMRGPSEKSDQCGTTATNQDFIAAYIGLVLMEICTWFWKEKFNEYSEITINWELNIGIPAKTWDDTKLSGEMKKAALAGWNISLKLQKSISIEDIGEAYKKARKQLKNDDYDEKKGQLHPDLVKSVPELVAEVMGFAQSQLRRDGMYLLTDVGATTLDISTFILHEDQDEENIFTILSSDVRPMGAYNLHKNRIVNSLSIYKEKLGSIDQSYDGISALPDFSSYQPGIDDNDYEMLVKTDECYLNDCSVVLRQVVGDTKRNRNPHSPAWDLGVPAFICGGGAQVDLYKQLIPYLGEKLRTAGINGFDVKNLPKPENLENEDILPQDYHRIAVSYGLSFSVDNIGTIIPERDVEDMEYNAPEVDISERYIDKDMV